MQLIPFSSVPWKESTIKIDFSNFSQYSLKKYFASPQKFEHFSTNIDKNKHQDVAVSKNQMCFLSIEEMNTSALG